MTRIFQIFRERNGPFQAVPARFAWLALPVPWLWAFANGLALRGLGLLALDGLFALLAPSLLTLQPIALTAILVIPRWIAFLRGPAWIAAQLEYRGLEYLGEIVARDRKDAVAQVARREGSIPEDLRPRAASTLFTFPPPSLQPWWSVARLTVRAAFRYRLVVVLMALLLGAVVVLPTVIKHDGTAQGFTQILLTYTLGVTTAILSLVTLWLACGTLARDVDECQMQVVATKPIPRWQIWLGKWTGIMLLNAMLLALSGCAVYLLMQWRATQLPAEVQLALRSNVLTARASLREPMPDIDGQVDELVRQRLADIQAKNINVHDFRTQARDVIKARQQLVPPEHFRQYRLDAGPAAARVRNQAVFVRLKFHTPDLGPKRPYEIEVVAGPQDSAQRRGVLRSLAAETTHEIELDNVALDARDTLIIDVANRSDTPLIIPLEDGFELLYREGGFGLNFVRAILVILCWLGLLAAIGLAAASFLSFPVAAFLATTILILGLSTGTLKTVVEDKTVLGFAHDTNQPMYPAFDALMVPVFKFLLDTVNLVQQFAPIDSLSTGRSITWGDLARAVGLVIILMGGIFAAIGMSAFTRRELATAQSNH